MSRGHAARCLWRTIQKGVLMFCPLNRRAKRSRLYRRICRNARLFQVSPSISDVNIRAHPDLYKPFDASDDDEELGDESADAQESATKKADEKLNNNGDDQTPISSDNGKVKQGDERKNGRQVA